MHQFRSFSTLLKLCKSLLWCVCLQCICLAPVSPSTLLPEPHNIVTLLFFNHLAVFHHLWKTISPLRSPVRSSGNLNVNPSLRPMMVHLCFLPYPLPSKSGAQNLFLWADHVVVSLPTLSLIFVFLLWKKILSLFTIYWVLILFWYALLYLRQFGYNNFSIYNFCVQNGCIFSITKVSKTLHNCPCITPSSLIPPEKTNLVNWSPLFYSQSSRVCFHWTFSRPFVPLCIKDERDSGFYPPSDLYHL